MCTNDSNSGRGSKTSSPLCLPSNKRLRRDKCALGTHQITTGELLIEIPKGADNLDILIVSNGGDPMVPLRIIGMVRERYKKIAALLPYAAYSAATLLALGADEIVMHPFSNLGPV